MFGVLWGFFKFILIFTFLKSSFSKELRNLGSCLIIIKLSFEVLTLKSPKSPSPTEFDT